MPQRKLGNLDIVWETIQTDLPELIESLENILPLEENQKLDPINPTSD
jgi:uncharacterized protein with HEPN domain